MAGVPPTERDLSQYMQLKSPNRHDRRRLEEAGRELTKNKGGQGVFDYKEFPDGSQGIRLIKATARFTGKFIGWAVLGNWDWITRVILPSGRESTSRKFRFGAHFEEGTGSQEFNMVCLKQNAETLPNASQANVYEEILGSDKGNPFR